MRYAVDALRRRKGRSVATAFGIGLATALVVVLLAVSEGVRVSSASLAASSGVDLFATSANTSLSGGTFPPITGAHTLATRVPAIDSNVATSSPWLVSSVEFANASLYAASNASANGSAVPGGWSPAESGSVGWVPGDNAGLETPSVLAGPGFSQAQDLHYANGSYAGPSLHEVVLDEDAATVLHVRVGDSVWASLQTVAGPSGLHAWFPNATPFKVVGISEPFWLIPSALLAFFYLSELQGLVGPSAVAQDTASILLIHLHDPTQAPADETRIADAFPGLSVFTVADILGEVASSIELYRTFGEVVGIIGVVVATLFTTTILQMSVDDRSREIALLRAIGYSRRTIGRFVVEEGLLLSLFGFAFGLPGGYIGAIALDRFLRGLVSNLPSSFSFISFDSLVLLTGLLEVLAIGLVASVLPAARAVTLPVAEELRAP